MKNHAIDALKKAGWNQEQINKFIAQMSLDTPTEDLSKIADEVNLEVKKVIENELRPTIRKEETGRQRDMNERILMKEWGKTESEIKEMFPDEKDRYPKMVAAFREDLSKGTDKTKLELQNELVAAKNVIKNLNEVEIPKIRGEVDLQKNEFTTETKMNDLMSGAAKYREGISTQAIRNAISPALKSKYDIKIDEEGLPQFYIKGTEKLATNSEGTKILSPTEVVAAQAQEFGFIAESNGTEQKKIVINEGEKKVSGILANHLDKAEAHQKSLTEKK